MHALIIENKMHQLLYKKLMYKNLLQPPPPSPFFVPLMDITKFNFQHFLLHC